MKKLLTGIGLIFFFNYTISFSKSNTKSYERLLDRIEMAKNLLNYMMNSPDKAIPQELIKKSHAIIFLKQYKGGFILGGKGGNGIILAKDLNTGEWSPLAFVVSIEGSFGFQIGAQVIESILLIMNKEGLDLLLKSKLKIGVDVSVVAGPVGRSVSGKISPPAAGILVYGRSKGIFGGVSIEGGTILSDDKANEKYYGIKGVKIRDILLRRKVEMTPECKELIEILKEYETMQIGEESQEWKLQKVS